MPAGPTPKSGPAFPCEVFLKFCLIFVYHTFCYQTFLTNFGALYLSEFLTDLGQILDSKSYDQVCKYMHIQGVPQYFGHLEICNFSASKVPGIKSLDIF